VLRYPALKLDGERIAAASRVYRERTVPITLGAAPIRSPLASRARKLPRCSDPDDQVFLELAQRAGVDWLLTRDRALLKLARAKHGLGFRIAAPETLEGMLVAASARP